MLLRVWNLMFLLMVLIIRFRVRMFVLSYISMYNIVIFLWLFIGFVFSISWLVVNSNFYWIMLGWDGLGVTSFLLIVYYNNMERVINGLFTIFQNRVGDLFFVLMVVIRMEFRRRIWVLKLSIVFIVLGACVKRAQFPFNRWLLAAIRAPTPISALVHSSTLVVAGVFIVLQYRYCLEWELEVLKFIRLLRLVVRLWGLLVEIDIKKLIAYSTLRHVGLILYIIRFKLYLVVFFHLNIHAIFKSIIFISFGIVIIGSFHSQDKRLVRLSGLNPLIIVCYCFSCLCLGGLPFLRAFFSKDLILEKLIEWSWEFSFFFFYVYF